MGIYIQYIYNKNCGVSFWTCSREISGDRVALFYFKWGGGGVSIFVFRKTILSHFMFSSRCMPFPTFLENNIFRGGGGGKEWCQKKLWRCLICWREISGDRVALFRNCDQLSNFDILLVFMYTKIMYSQHSAFKRVQSSYFFPNFILNIQSLIYLYTCARYCRSLQIQKQNSHLVHY